MIATKPKASESNNNIFDGLSLATVTTTSSGELTLPNAPNHPVVIRKSNATENKREYVTKSGDRPGDTDEHLRSLLETNEESSLLNALKENNSTIINTDSYSTFDVLLEDNINASNSALVKLSVSPALSTVAQAKQLSTLYTTERDTKNSVAYPSVPTLNQSQSNDQATFQTQKQAKPSDETKFAKAVAVHVNLSQTTTQSSSTFHTVTSPCVDEEEAEAELQQPNESSSLLSKHRHSESDSKNINSRNEVSTSYNPLYTSTKTASASAEATSTTRTLFPLASSAVYNSSASQSQQQAQAQLAPSHTDSLVDDLLCENARLLQEVSSLREIVADLSATATTYPTPIAADLSNRSRSGVQGGAIGNRVTSGGTAANANVRDNQSAQMSITSRWASTPPAPMHIELQDRSSSMASSSSSSFILSEQQPVLTAEQRGKVKYVCCGSCRQWLLTPVLSEFVYCPRCESVNQCPPVSAGHINLQATHSRQPTWGELAIAPLSAFTNCVRGMFS